MNDRARSQKTNGTGRSAFLLGTAALSAFFSAPALAQSSAATTSNDEIVVTGTSIRGVVVPTGAAVIGLSKEDIQQVGAANTSQLMAKVPQFSSFLTLPTTISPSIGLTVGVALRGLPTLVLLDGQRQVSDSANTSQFNINSIPQGAIERIEVVPDGGSAIYGSDAIGGVVNIITRRNFNGGDFSLRYGLGHENYNVFDVSGSVGKTWDGGSAIVSVLYNKTDPFLTKNVTARVLDQTSRGGQDLRSTSCFPPNLRVGTTVYAPPNYAVGTVRCDTVGNSTLIGESENKGVLGNFHQDLSENLHLFFSGRYTKITSIDFGAPPSNGSLAINNANPFLQRPPGTGTAAVTALYNSANIWGADLPRTDGLGTSVALAGGLEYKFGKWRAVGTYNYGRGVGDAEGQGNNTTALSAAANATTAATALDPFGFGTSPAVVAAIKDQRAIFHAAYSLRQAIARLDGPLFELPGGEVKLAFGAETIRQEYHGFSMSGPYNTSTGYAEGNGSRDVNSAYGEVLVPLFSDSNGMPGLRSLILSGAVRYDDYDSFGGTTNPKLGFDWRPIQDLRFRGNYGKSFIAPVLTDTNASDTRAQWAATGALLPPGDPRASNATAQILIAGGNSNLRPQTSETYSYGFDFTPSWLDGLKASATYYRVEFKDRIGLAPFTSVQVYTDPIYTSIPIAIPNASVADLQKIIDTFRLVNFPSTSAAALAATPNGVVIVDARRQNLSSQIQKGLDVSLDYGWDSGIGRFNASLSGNYVLELQNSTGPGAPYLDDITRVPFRGRVGLDYSTGPVRTNVSVNYIDKQTQTYTNGAAVLSTYDIPSFTTVDLSATYRLEELKGEVSLTVNNALDAEPPFSYGGNGYRGVDPLGRVIYLGLRKSF